MLPLRVDVRCALALCLQLHATAQEYVPRSLGVAEGLANERVNCLLQDRKGYLWFGTWEGVSRFDGAEFSTLSTQDGLEKDLVDGLAEDAHGRIWIATHGGGLARFVDDPLERARLGGKRVATYKLGAERETNLVHSIAVAAADCLWCGTEAGLFRADVDAAGVPRFERVLEGRRLGWATISVVTGGSVFLAEGADVVEIRDGRAERRPVPEVPGKREVRALARAANGDLLVATAGALFACSHVSAAPSGSALDWRRIQIELGGRDIQALLGAADGSIWVGTRHGILRLTRDGTLEEREPQAAAFSFLEDREGDVWVGTWSQGALELSPSLVRSWTLADGIPDRSVVHVHEAQDGHLVAATEGGLFEIVDGRVRAVEHARDPLFLDVGMRFVQARSGDWWIGTDRGLYHCAGSALDLGRAQRVAFETEPTSPTVFGRIHEGPEGRLIFGVMDGRVYSVDPGSEAGDSVVARPFGPEHPPWNGPPREIERDSSGALWLATYTGLYRLRADRADDIGIDSPASDMQPRCFHEDAAGRLWIGMRTAGAWRIDDPRADRPTFARLTKLDGLPSDAVWSIAEDPLGRLWFATARGLGRLAPGSGSIETFTTLDGLAGDIVSHVICDARGTVWAATSGGISAIDARASLPARCEPPVFIVRIRAGGVDVPILETGVVHADPIELEAGSSDLAIDMSSPTLRGARRVRFEHRLAESEAWSPPSAQRTVELARLAPGHYRFEARARIEGDVASATPALLEIDVLPPIWQRPWFLGLAALAAAAAGYSVHRARLQRVLALERIRGQIAADLHDDLGSGLSQIAILSEVARRDAPAAARAPLEEVASLARSLRESVGEIVWAVDPKKDQVGELVRRMRQVAYNLLEVEGVRVEFRVTGDRDVDAIGLAPDQRRHLLLVLKEALANVARHAHATRAEVELAVEGRRLRLTIHDDGQGFDAGSVQGGHGLSSLRRRAEALHAELVIRSQPAEGTTIELSMPVR